MNFLSKGGRLTLIKSKLTNLPIYLSTIILPVNIAKRLEAIKCRFLYGDGEGKRRYHLVKWEDVKLHKNQGAWG